MRLIDADMFYDRLNDMTKGAKPCVCKIIDMCMTELDNQLTIEPKRGKWKGYWKSQFMGCDDFGEPIYRDGKIYYCSKCNRRAIIKENFCPNCGAKMEDEND